MKRVCFILFLLMGAQAKSQTIILQTIASELSSPVAMTHAGDGSGRLFVCEQNGVVRVIKNGELLKQPFLDIRDRIIKQSGNYSERGLLGIAFHPQYKKNGCFYVYYSAASTQKGSNHKSVVAAYKVSAANANLADKNSERVVMEIEQPESNHNGGQLALGPDGYLYIGLGDGGGAGDRHGSIGNGQDMETLLGKIIRIDVNTDKGYRIPADNPFVNKPGRDEIWAFGLRNPWKFSFDRESGRLFCVDVGQDKYEEVNIIRKGGNYGWRVMEGFHCYNPAGGCDRKELELPIDEYRHPEGVCVIGGHVYRGRSHGNQGRYFYGDWSGAVFILSELPSKTWKREQAQVPAITQGTYINAFGEDEEGELYVLLQKGTGPAVNTGVLCKMLIN